MGEDIGAKLSDWLLVVDRARLDQHVEGLKKIAYYLARRANNDGTHVYPGVNRTAVECEVSPATVRRAFEVLRKAGLIELANRGNSRAGKANEYRLTIGPDVLERLDVPDPARHAAAIEALGETDRKRNAKRWARLHPKEITDDQPEPGLSPLPIQSGDDDPESGLSPLPIQSGDSDGSGASSSRDLHEDFSEPLARSPEPARGSNHRSPMQSGDGVITAHDGVYHRSPMGERSTPISVNSQENSTLLFGADGVRENLAATCAREAGEEPEDFDEEEKDRTGEATADGDPLTALLPSAKNKPAAQKTPHRDDDPVAAAQAFMAAKRAAYQKQLAAQGNANATGDLT